MLNKQQSSADTSLTTTRASPSPGETVAGPDFALVVPTFNERDNIRPLYDRLVRVLDGRNWEVVFVDDNSPDGTWSEIEDLSRSDRRVRGLRRIGRRGLSSACIEGFLSTTAPVVAVMDADLQHDENRLPDLLDATTAGADVAIGSRHASGGSVGDFTANRKRISDTATRLSRLVLKQPVSDPMSGFFAIRRPVLEAVLPRLSGSGFKILLDILTSARQPLAVHEVPYTFGTREHGESKLDSMVAVEFLELVLDKFLGRNIPVKFLMFAAIGGIGLIVHLVVLRTGLGPAGLSFAAAQSLAVLVAMTGNFFLNNRLTYRDRRLRGRKMLLGLLSFYAICSLGAVANVGVGSLIYQERPVWWLAGTAGAVVGAVWNFAVSSVYTWRSR